jgi:hypothetical protein
LAIGPLKTERFLRAKIGRPGELGPMPPPPNVDLLSAKEGRVPRAEGGGLRDTRIPDGKIVLVGVAGSIFTELCGDLGCRDADVVLKPEGLARLALEVDEAFECVCWCLGTEGYALRMDDTEELVLFLPRNPEERR